METGEIVALVVIVIVLILGSVFLCFRCWKAVSEVTKDANEPRRETFIRSFRDGLRQSFRSSLKRVSSFRNSFRRSGSGRQRAGVPPARRPTPVVATIENLRKETSEIHPYYLEKRNPQQTSGHSDFPTLEHVRTTAQEDRGANSRSYKRLVEQDSPNPARQVAHSPAHTADDNSEGFANPGFQENSPSRAPPGGAPVGMKPEDVASSDTVDNSDNCQEQGTGHHQMSAETYI